ncbi:MAG: hypothetical protein QGF00_37550, partial [Planctomycetota bacterium]|nr:hypothetical protein [Planctomycetota bacterium]
KNVCGGGTLLVICGHLNMFLKKSISFEKILPKYEKCFLGAFLEICGHCEHFLKTFFFEKVRKY